MLASTAFASPLICTYTIGDDWNQYCIMMDEYGTLLTPRDTYGNIYCFTYEPDGDSPRLYSASKAVADNIAKTSEYDYDDYSYGYNNPVALMDEGGNLLTGFDYTGFTHHVDKNLVVYYGMTGLQGVMDESGKVLLPDRFITICPNGKGGYLALVCPEGEMYNYDTYYPIVYIDERGRTFETEYSCHPYGFTVFSEGFVAVTLNSGSDSSCVYLDHEGTNVFRQTYGWANSFYGNYASVTDSETGLVGLIDKTGQWALPPEYRSIDQGEYHGAKVFLACKNSAATILDAGNLDFISAIDFTLSGCSYGWFAGKYFISAFGDNASGLYDLDGNLIYSGSNSADYWYGHMNETPGRIIRTVGIWPEDCCYLSDLSGNVYGPLFQALTTASWIDGQGRYVFATYDMAPDEDGQIYPDWDSYRYGLCDQNGNILLDARYTSIDPISPSRYWVRLGSRFGLIDETGKWYYTIDDYEYLMD